MPDQRFSIDRKMMRVTLQIVGLTLFISNLLSDAREIGESLTRPLQLFFASNSPDALLIYPFRLWVGIRAGHARPKFDPCCEE